MKRLLLLLILLILMIPVKAQEFIGRTEKEIRQAIAVEKPGLTPDNTVRNDTYRYLKYHSRDDNETWLIFFGRNGKCNGVRITCSNSLYDSRLDELNRKYRPVSGERWTYRAGSDEISVKLKKEDWFFTITYELSGK